MSPAWAAALRRGAVPLVLGLVCWALSFRAIEDLHPLLVGLGAILVALGLVIVVATARTMGAEERRVRERSLAGQPAKLPLDGQH